MASQMNGARRAAELLRRAAAWVACAGSLVIAVCNARADRAEIISSADTTLIETAPNANMGGACIVNAGTAKIANARNRGLFLFDLAGAIPANAVVTDVTLILGVTGEPSTGFLNANYSLHRMLQPWGEGDKGNPNCPPEPGSGPGLGGLATEGEATWLHRFALTTETWAAPGGAADIDYVAASSAEQLIYGTGDSPYHFGESITLTRDVQGWLDDPKSNFGWMLLCDSESDNGTARRFGSREDPSSPPTLVVDYVVVPEPGVFAIFGVGIGWVILRGTVRFRDKR